MLKKKSCEIFFTRKTPYYHIQCLHMPAGITEEEGSGGEWNTFLHIQHTHIVYSSSLDIYRQHKIALSYWVTKKSIKTSTKPCCAKSSRGGLLETNQYQSLYHLTNSQALRETKHASWANYGSLKTAAFCVWFEFNPSWSDFHTLSLQ